MTMTSLVPRGLHRRVAMAVGVALVRWSAGRRESIRYVAVPEVRSADAEREERIRRYHVDRQVQWERDHAVFQTGMLVHSVM